MILNIKYNYEKLLIHNPQYFANRTFDSCFLSLRVRARCARGNVSIEQNKLHRAPLRLESEETSFPRKITPQRSHRGKVNRGDCTFLFPVLGIDGTLEKY